jgi:hypothetical protein
MSKIHKVEIPEELWAGFVDIVYAAILHITPTEENEGCLLYLQNIVEGAIEDGTVLVVDGKIVGREDYIKEE